MNKKPRRITALLLTVLMLFTLTACGKTETPVSTPSPVISPESTVIPEAEAADTPAKEETAATATPVTDIATAETDIPSEEKAESVKALSENPVKMTKYEFLDVTLAFRTDFFQYVSQKEGVFDLLSMAKDLGYVSYTENGASDEESYVFSNPENTLQVGLEEAVTEEGIKIFKAIRYKTEKESILCTFERTDRFDGSPLYSVNIPDSYTVSMDQILLLTYIMENISNDNTDPLAGYYSSEYWTSGMYRFPV